MKKLHTLYLLAILAFLLGAACSNNDPDEMPEPDDGPGMSINPYDTASIAWVLDNIMNYVPSWEELEKFTDTATFLTTQDFTKKAANYALVEGNPYGEDYVGGLLADIDQLQQYYGANESSSNFNDMPPFYQPGEPFLVPYELNRLDEKLRATTVLHLLEKSKGLPVTLVNLYAPFAEWGDFATKSDFDTWFESEYLPEKVAEAKAAELMKAERYIPWPLELEVYIYKVGGVGNSGFLDGAPAEEVLAFANEVKTRIFNTVRPHYSGTLVAHIHNNYFNRPEHHFWDQMSYSEFDEIHCAFFPPFDPETTEAYMDEQLAHYTKIIENSGNLPWLAAEVSVFEWYVQDGMFQSFEKDMYQRAFNKLDAAPIPPRGLLAAAGYMQTDAAKELLKQYFASH